VKRTGHGDTELLPSATFIRPDLPKISTKTAKRLAVFTSLLREWAQYQNLISTSDMLHVWSRHVLDSLQILQLVPSANRWLDIGSGAGFPAVIIASFLAENPGAEVTCVESDRRKCAFLSTVAREAKLPLKIFPRHSQLLRSDEYRSFDVVTARAVTDLNNLIKITEPHLTTGAKGIFQLGAHLAESPCNQIPNIYTCECVSSITNSNSIIVTIQIT
jgi:16S rRNA (guanine527-N7)-methyltransferase